ncbi:MAG: glyoxalase family protein [Patescibacteria group bacterium]|jgi:glyoxalase family protein|nr:glyoxalase family protein [Patescibacteria group bacterium]
MLSSSQIVHGIHHITAIASDPTKTVDFYTNLLGLRLVKKSVNQDDVQAYHLFFGDRTGEPGMDLTFFTFPHVMQGLQGVGQVTKISLAVPEQSLDFWMERFEAHQIDHDPITTQFGTQRIVFYDFDQQRLELVGVAQAEYDLGIKDVWTTSEISKEHAIGYFYAATLNVSYSSLIEPILTKVLRYQQIEAYRYHIATSPRAKYLEIEEHPVDEGGINAAGTVHHIAFEVADEKALLAARERVLQTGLYPTEVINRYYFKSVYFRTKAGILFELATSGPGFAADEDEKDFGKKLALPPFLEDRREEIEANLEPL